MRRIILAIRQGDWVSPDRVRGYTRLFLALFGLAGLLWAGLAAHGRDLSGKPLGPDFLNVYAAGTMVARGEAPQVYDWTAHHQAEAEAMGETDRETVPYYGWHYPPLFLGLARVVALLPYQSALFFYLLAGFGIYLMAFKTLLPKAEGSWMALASFPGVFVNIWNGQNGFLTTALLAGGLALLDKMPVVAGLLLGGLSYKPQFFALIPVVLFLGHKKKTALVSLGTAVLGGILSIVLWGDKTWLAFVSSLSLTRHSVLEQGNTGWYKIQSVFSFVRATGGNVSLAYFFQILASVFAAFTVIRIWRRDEDADTRGAALVAAALLATPYMLDYDLVALAVPIALLARAGLRTGFLTYEKSLLAALWLLPLVARLAERAFLPLTSCGLVALLGVCSRRSQFSESGIR